jgi:hypothetical protein
MSAEKTVTDRLLQDARRKTAQQESPTLGRVALGFGILAVLASPISIAGWVLAVITLAVALVAQPRPASARHARIAFFLAGAAVLIGVFFFSLSVALNS